MYKFAFMKFISFEKVFKFLLYIYVTGPVRIDHVSSIYTKLYFH